MTLSAEEIAQFHQRGFIVAKGFFGTSVIGQVSAWLAEMQQRSESDGADARYYEKGPATGQGILVQVEHFLGDRNPQITKLLLPGKVMECLTQLFGEPPVLFKEKVNYKLPGCRADKLHQDQSAGWNAYTHFFITMAVVWMPIGGTMRRSPL